jgi:hypothetical protein
VTTAELDRFAANREYDKRLRAHLVRNNAFLRAMSNTSATWPINISDFSTLLHDAQMCNPSVK